MSKTYYVYIIECGDGSYYTGVTNNLGLRMEQHLLSKAPSYTATRKPLKLVYSQEHPDIHEAISAEKQIKGWRREKKQALIRGDIYLLPGLSRTYGRPSSGSG